MTKSHLPTVEEFTNLDPFTASVNARLDELTMIMKEKGIRQLPLTNNGAIVGIVSERDLRVVENLTQVEKGFVRACDIMVRAPVTVSADTSLEEVAFEMSQRKIGSVLVTDENGNYLGIFTATDALNALVELARSPR